jgi:hypothetical protein
MALFPSNILSATLSLEKVEKVHNINKMLGVDVSDRLEQRHKTSSYYEKASKWKNLNPTSLYWYRYIHTHMYIHMYIIPFSVYRNHPQLHYRAIQSYFNRNEGEWEKVNVVTLPYILITIWCWSKAVHSRSVLYGVRRYAFGRLDYLLQFRMKYLISTSSEAAPTQHSSPFSSY